MKKLNIMVLGATGNTGLQFVNMALERGHKVTAIIRSSSSLDKQNRLNIIEGDVLNPIVLNQSFRGMDVIVSCLGIRKENPSDPWSPLLSPEDFVTCCMKGIIKSMKLNGVKRLVAISSAGVGDSWELVDSELRQVIQSSNVGKIFLDLNNMEKLLEESGLDTLAIRPVALVTGNTIAGAKIVNRFDKTSKILTGDVALWMLNAVEREAPFNKRTEMIVSKQLPSDR